MTAYRQNANGGCNSCASLAGLVLCFIACFILLVIAALGGEAAAADEGASTINAAVGVGERTAREDAMLKKIFDEVLETAQDTEQPDKCRPPGAILSSESAANSAGLNIFDYFSHVYY